MMMYELHLWEDPEDGDQVVLFASSPERARQIFQALERRFDVPEGWVADAWDCWQEFGLVRHEHEACERCMEGVGVYHSGSGWTILPLDYDALGLAPNPGQYQRR